MNWKNDLNHGLGAFGLRIPDGLTIDQWAAKLTDKPCAKAAALVGASAVLFYAAERGHNPKVRDLYDALVYCTTNISVGYCDIFAHTPVGKLIGSTLMTLGPAMAAKTLDGKKSEVDGDTQRQILATLQEIAAKLNEQPAARDG